MRRFVRETVEIAGRPRSGPFATRSIGSGSKRRLLQWRSEWRIGLPARLGKRFQRAVRECLAVEPHPAIRFLGFILSGPSDGHRLIRSLQADRDVSGGRPGNFGEEIRDQRLDGGRKVSVRVPKFGNGDGRLHQPAVFGKLGIEKRELFCFQQREREHREFILCFLEIVSHGRRIEITIDILVKFERLLDHFLGGARREGIQNRPNQRRAIRAMVPPISSPAKNVLKIAKEIAERRPEYMGKRIIIPIRSIGGVQQEISGDGVLAPINPR